MGMFDTTFEEVLAGRRARLSWRQLLSGGRSEPRELRRFILIRPELDYDALEPAGAAIDPIRRTAADLGLTPDRGLHVRLTGPAPVESDEFATLKENAGLNAALTVTAVAFILYLALRSGRVIFAVLATTFAGLIATAGVGLLMVGQFNPISVALRRCSSASGSTSASSSRCATAPSAMIGSVLREAIVAAGRGVGVVADARRRIAACRLLLVPADRIPRRLGAWTDCGRGDDHRLRRQPDPAARPTTVLHPPGELDRSNRPRCRRRPLDRREPAPCPDCDGRVVLGGVPFLLKLPFDANPMNLRSQEVESVATFLDLAKDPQPSPNTSTSLAPALEAAKSLAKELEALPEVSHRLPWRLHPGESGRGTGPHPGRRRCCSTQCCIRRRQAAQRRRERRSPASTAAALREVAGANAGAANDTARRLPDILDRLAAARPRQACGGPDRT